MRDALAVPVAWPAAKGPRGGEEYSIGLYGALPSASGILPSLRRTDVVPLLTGLPVLVLFTWWMFAGGGYAPTVWEPGVLLLLALLGVLALTQRGRRLPPRPVILALGAFAAYTVWSYLSVLWAQAPGDAMTGSHRTLLYLLVLGAMGTAGWTVRSLLVVLGGWAAAVGIAAVVQVLRLGSDDALAQVSDARLVQPMGYMNADAAFWTMGALVAIGLAASPHLHALVRTALLAAATLDLQLAVMTQSRGWLFLLPVMLVAALVLVRHRWRLLACCAPVAAGVLVALPALLEPYDVGGGRVAQDVAAVLQDTLQQTGGRIWAGVAVAAAVALVLTLADARFRSPSPLAARSRQIGAAAVGLAVLAAVAGGVAAADGDPVGRLDRAWESFKDFGPGAQSATSNRFSSLGSARYDFWRVSLNSVAKHPVAGIGQDTFAQEYVLRRRSTEEPRWTHSLELRLLVHTGIVGLLLFLAFTVALAVAVRRAARDVGAIAGIALLPGVVWLVHGSIDWFWEFPALSGPALGFAAAAATLARQDRAGPTAEVRPALRPGLRRGLQAGAAVLAVAGFAVVGGAFVAERTTSLAATEWRADRDQALDRLALASDLSPWDPRPALVAGLIRDVSGDAPGAIASLREAWRRSPDDWVAPFQLGLVEGNVRARTDLDRARARNPREPLIREALRRLDSQRPMTAQEAAERFRARLRYRLGRAAPPD